MHQNVSTFKSIASFPFDDSHVAFFSIVFSVNFPTFYREIFTALIDAMHRKFDKNAQSSNQLKTWDSSVRIIEKLLLIAKLLNISRVYYFYLKVEYSYFPNKHFSFNQFMENDSELLFPQNTLLYIKLFLQHGMMSIETSLHRKVNDVVAFLGLLQHSTRFLHSLCCHSKVLCEKTNILLLHINVEND